MKFFTPFPDIIIYFPSRIIAGLLESANLFILASRNLFRGGGEKIRIFFVNEIFKSQ